MNIIIVGCGQVGETLAAELREENNDITVVDLSPDKINSISTRLDVMGIVGNGATHTVQMEAGITKPLQKSLNPFQTDFSHFKLYAKP